MTGHVSDEAMADFRAGLLPAREAAMIGAHLSTCSRCAELDAQLASVTSLLAATPTPPMPAALAARLDAALAAEAAARVAGTAAGSRRARGPGCPGVPRPAAGCLVMGCRVARWCPVARILPPAAARRRGLVSVRLGR